MICRVIIIGFIGENIKNSQNHLFGQLDRFSVLSSTKFAVRLIELPFMLQHDREFVTFRFYFPLFIKLLMVFLCVILIVTRGCLSIPACHVYVRLES